MKLKHVFWQDAIREKNDLDLFFIIGIFGFYGYFGSDLLKATTGMSDLHMVICTLIGFVMILALSFYLAISLSALLMCDEFFNDGERDGSYWAYHFYNGIMIALTGFIFLVLLFHTNTFYFDGSLSTREILFELPMLYLLFFSIVYTLVSISLFVVYLGVDTFRNLFIKKENIVMDENEIKLENNPLQEMEQFISREWKEPFASLQLELAMLLTHHRGIIEEMEIEEQHYFLRKLGLLCQSLYLVEKLKDNKRVVYKNQINTMFFSLINELEGLAEKQQRKMEQQLIRNLSLFDKI